MKANLTNHWATADLARKWVICCSAVGLAIALGNAPAVVGQELGAPRNTTSVTPAPGMTRPTLRLGSQGTEVAELQAALKLLGYYTGTVDGFYNESTAIAVAGFQQAAGLSVDNIVGPATWNRLFPPSPPVASATGPNPPTLSPAPNPPAAFPAPTLNRATATAPQPPANSTTDVSSAQPSRASTPSATTTQAPTVELPILKPGMRGPAVTRLQERLQATGFLKAEPDGVFGSQTEAAVKAAQERYRLSPDGIVGPATWKVILR